MADASVVPATPHAGHGAQRRRRWKLFTRALGIAFLLLVCGAVALYLRKVEWQPVLAALRDYHSGTLALAAALAVASCLLYASFDLLSRHEVGHRLAAPWVLAVAFSSYTINLNLGTWIGSLGMRLRLYPRLGVHSTDVLRIVALTTVTNWQGYFALAGVALALYPPARLPEDWPVAPDALRLAGVLLLGVATSYCALCAFAKRRTVTIRKFRLHLPSFRFSLLQTAVAAANWLLIALVPYTLMHAHVSFQAMIVALLLACSAGAIAHIPAGLGVIEAVLLAMLGRDVPTPHLVAGLLAYRAVYYLWPFALGLATFGITELLIRRRALPAAAAP